MDNCILSDHYDAARGRNYIFRFDLGNKCIRNESILSESYISQNECEKKLAKYKGKNKISEVDTL